MGQKLEWELRYKQIGNSVAIKYQKIIKNFKRKNGILNLSEHQQNLLKIVFF